MPRATARLLIAGVAAGAISMAARAHAQAAVPFEPVGFTPPPSRSHAAAWITGGAGLALIGGSFAWANAADSRYAAYLAETDVRRIDERWRATVRADRLASGALLAGEVLLVSAVYLRFIRRPSSSPVAVVLEPHRCALAWRF